MRRGFAGAWFMAGLALIGTMAVGGREAQAGGVSVKLGVGKGGDPIFTYDETVSVTDLTVPQSSAGNSSLSITFTNITGITGTGTVGPPPFESSPDNVTIISQNPAALTAFWTVILNSANGGTITLLESNPYGPITVTGTQQLVEVQIVTPADTPAGLVPGDMRNYTGNIGTTPVQGTVTLYSIPEPSSMIMMLLGGTMLPFFAIRERARRSRRIA